MFLIKIFGRLLISFVDIWKLESFKTKWRTKNRHNFTSTTRVFPIDLVDVGKRTYGEITVYVYADINKVKLTIGNYVSIASNVVFILGGNHHLDTITSYPIKNFMFKDFYKDSYSKGPINVEDEVWIGYGAIIMSGVTIGKGAMIAAGALVTKDVPPYAVVGGNPAKIIKYRFNEELISALKSIDLAAMTDEFITANKELFYNRVTDVEDLACLKKIK